MDETLKLSIVCSFPCFCSLVTILKSLIYKVSILICWKGSFPEVMSFRVTSSLSWWRRQHPGPHMLLLKCPSACTRTTLEEEGLLHHFLCEQKALCGWSSADGLEGLLQAVQDCDWTGFWTERPVSEQIHPAHGCAVTYSVSCCSQTADGNPLSMEDTMAGSRKVSHRFRSSAIESATNTPCMTIVKLVTCRRWWLFPWLKHCKK